MLFFWQRKIGNKCLWQALHIRWYTPHLPCIFSFFFNFKGGQTIARDGYIIDMKWLNKIHYFPSTTSVEVEPGNRQCGGNTIFLFTMDVFHLGADWGQVIFYLNRFGMSPMTMQSYSSFSVGGTVSVNGMREFFYVLFIYFTAHGITNDYCMYESILSIQVVNAEGELVECSREKNGELFSACIGGYGLFGIITLIRLKCVPNVKISMEMVKLNSSEFSSYYQQFIENEEIDVKLARIDVTSPSNIYLFLFRRVSTTPTISDLVIYP